MQFLQEFKRYQELIRRPSIQRELIAERENLLAKISEYVQNERKSFSTNGAKWETKDFSKPVSNIYFVHHAEARFGDVIKTGELILSDLGNHIHKFSPFKPFLDWILMDHPCKHDTAQCTMEPLKALSDQAWIR